MCAIEFNSQKYLKENWDSLPKEVQAKCESDPIFAEIVGKSLASGGRPSDMSVLLAGSKEKSPTAPLTGLELEKAGTYTPNTGVITAKDAKGDINALKPKYDIADLENKDIRKVAQAQWKEYFIARAQENPDEARSDMVQVFYRKEVAQIKAGMEKMLKDSKQSRVLKAKYLSEGYTTADGKTQTYASEKEKTEYENRIKELTAEYKNEKGNAKAIRDYNALFREPGKNDPIDEGGRISPSQLDALVKLKALDSVEIDGDRLDKMAVSAIVDYKFNEGLRKSAEIQDQIDKLKRENLTPKAKKLQDEAIKKDNEYAKQIATLLLEAENEESIAFAKDAAAKNKEMEAEVAKLKRLGAMEDAEALEQQRVKYKQDSEAKHRTLLDQTKLAEAEKLDKERADAREVAGKAVYEALDQKTKDKIIKLEGKRQEAVQKGKESALELTSKNIENLAELFAEVQIDIQEAEAKYNNTVVHWDKDPSINEKDGKRHTYLNNDIREIVQENPDIFAREPKEGETADFTVDGKSYKFDSDKYKEYMLRLSNDNQLDNEDANDAGNRADFLANIKERKEFVDAKEGHSVKASFKDRRLAGKCYDIAGIDIERDRTILKRLGHTALGGLKGAVAGGAVTMLAEYLSTTKIVESKFFKLVEYSGSVPFSKVVHYSGDQDVTLTGKYKGTYHVDDYVPYSQTVEVEGVASKYVEFGYEDEAGYSGVASDSYSGIASTEVIHTDEYNGIPVGEQITNVDIPYSGTVDIPYSGTVTVSGTVGGNVEIPYKQVVTVDGKVHYVRDFDIEDDVTLTGTSHYEGDIVVEEDVQYSGEKEVSGVTRERVKMNWDNVVKGIITGAIGGTLNALGDWGKIYDEGDRKYSIARKLVSDKDLNRKPTTPPKLELDVPDEDVTLLEQEIINNNPESEIEPESCKAHAEKDLEVESEYEMVLDMTGNGKGKGKLLYDAIAKAYNITDPKELKEAIGIVKGWHGISQEERKYNVWISQLGLKKELKLSNRTCTLQPIKEKDIAEYKEEAKTPGVYASMQPAAVIKERGKVYVTCAGEEGKGELKEEYSNYKDAEFAAQYYNDNDQVLLSQEDIEKMRKNSQK